MHRTLTYLLLFAVTVLLQVFLFDNLSMSIFLNPLIYILFIILLPLDARPIVVLLAGLAMGMVMDMTMGAAGENTIATLFVAFLRGWIISLFNGREAPRDGGIPSAERMGARCFIEYIVVIVLLHHIIFFSLESLSWSHLWHTLLRIVASSTVSIGFIWVVARLFTTKFLLRV